jgi:hypothetical protein
MCKNQEEMGRGNGSMQKTVSGKPLMKKLEKKDEKNEGDCNCKETDDKTF